MIKKVVLLGLIRTWEKNDQLITINVLFKVLQIGTGTQKWEDGSETVEQQIHFLEFRREMKMSFSFCIHKVEEFKTIGLLCEDIGKLFWWIFALVFLQQEI